MAAILRDSTVVVVFVCTRPRAIPLAMITARKSIHGFSLVSYMCMGPRSVALRALGALLVILPSPKQPYYYDCDFSLLSGEDLFAD